MVQLILLLIFLQPICFISADANLDSEKLKDKYKIKGIIANFVQNKQKGNGDNDYFFEEK